MGSWNVYLQIILSLAAMIKCSQIFIFFFSHMEEVARFPGMKPHKQLTYASKQLIAREVTNFILGCREKIDIFHFNHNIK